MTEQSRQFTEKPYQLALFGEGHHLEPTAPEPAEPESPQYKGPSSDFEFGHRNRRGVSQPYTPPMLMTTREILATHKPLEGDREDYSNPEFDFDQPESDDNPSAYKEDDDQFWERKYIEAESDTGYQEGSDKNNYFTTRSLADSIEEEGVRNPVDLQYPDMKPPPRLHYYPGMPDEGDVRPDILGGHHRLAVMHWVDPDRLIPVRFSEDIMQARRGKDYFTIGEGGDTGYGRIGV